MVSAQHTLIGCGGAVLADVHRSDRRHDEDMNSVCGVSVLKLTAMSRPWSTRFAVLKNLGQRIAIADEALLRRRLPQIL